MTYHKETLEMLMKVSPSTKNTVAILDALLQGHSISEIVENSTKFNIKTSGASLRSQISKIRAHLPQT